MEAIGSFFKIEKDPFYIKGQQTARAKAEKEKKEMAIVLKNKNVAVDIIVEATGLSIKL
jgi:hypothetical protein